MEKYDIAVGDKCACRGGSPVQLEANTPIAWVWSFLDSGTLHVTQPPNENGICFARPAGGGRSDDDVFLTLVAKGDVRYVSHLQRGAPYLVVAIDGDCAIVADYSGFVMGVNLSTVGDKVPPLNVPTWGMGTRLKVGDLCEDVQGHLYKVTEVGDDTDIYPVTAQCLLDGTRDTYTLWGRIAGSPRNGDLHKVDKPTVRPDRWYLTRGGVIAKGCDAGDVLGQLKGEPEFILWEDL